MKNCPFVLALPLLWATVPSPLPAMQAAALADAVSPVLSAKDRQEIVAQLSQALRERYVFPDIGEQAATKIDAALTTGVYDMLTAPGALAMRLSSDVGAVTHDKHLRIWSDDAPPQPAPGAGKPPPTEGGIARADKLAGGIGYIEIIGFPPPGPFKRVLDKAMSSLSGSKQLIIDMRRNGGGSPEAVAYLVSFLVAPGRPINDIVSRVEKTSSFTRESYASVATPVGFAQTPIYVLTSEQTFSGGEEFAYDVQALKRGTLIGEVTGGGANPTGFVDLGHSFGATIPFGRAENPVTKTNWEGRGVQPDIKVPATDALAAALTKAGVKPASDIASASIQQVFAPRSTPTPGSEAAIRHLLAGLASGKPDYTALSPDVADMARGHLPELQAAFSSLGALLSVKFHGPDMLGGDEYILHFAHGNRMMALLLGPNGKIVAVSTPMPLPDGE